MSRPVVAVTRKLFDDSCKPIQQTADLRLSADDAALDADGIVAHASGASAVIATTGCPLNAAVLERLPELRMIANVGVGYNNIDIAAATERGILVSNTPDVLTESTADMAWALLLAAARRVGASERWLREGQWNRWAIDLWLGADLHATTMGIVGMGRIGQAIARRARGFGMDVVYHNRRPLPENQAEGARWVSKEELLSTSDHVLLVVPYSPATHHIIDAQALALMKSSAVLVNIGRGGLVDDAALAQALSTGQIAAAGLDVFENEPQIHPDLLAAPNAVLTPHIGSATNRTRRGMCDLAVANVADWLEGKPPRTLVNPEALPK